MYYNIIKMYIQTILTKPVYYCVIYSKDTNDNIFILNKYWYAII
ncbi:hypothetical protein MTBPR1_50092 [Candidatus Terasakiella magnetica]|uniref:Uncharacterized protein n=1 Tax=Candidatus Terasakiella magnetica TaxID=1867952 RepID=A0A1C3RJ93_9PROT|nr:hypothetical protein MTBPR1_50092 [Candidatus Terasakiella magnetica]